MKKLLSFLIFAAMMVCAVFPVSAAEEAPEGLAEEVYHAQQRLNWAEYEESMKVFVEQNPETVVDFCQTYEEYCEEYPMESFDYFEYLGSYADGEASIWLVSYSQTFTIRCEFVGDYWISTGSIYGGANNPGFAVYTDGELIYLPDAYEQGVIDDDDLAELYKQDFYLARSEKGMRRVGDMDDSNSLDVADIIGMKDHIMNLRDNDFFGETNRSYADFDQSGCVDVGDIVALKNHIMGR